ncbi:MAG: 50S ribosomal protein L10 [Candidatus Azambacteria bacterium]|nr:50S ribosomal protein L10 [Candidatus Azambacteria bacterium]
MAITRAKKEEIIEGLKDKLGRAKTVVFARYKGLTVADLTVLRNELKEAEGEGWVVKNRLTKIALKDKTEVPDKILKGQTALFFSYKDELTAPKIVYKTAKNNENLKIKGGIFEDKFIEANEVEKLAQIPGREELLAKMVGSLNAPISGFVGALRGNLLNLLYTLNEIQKSKS